MKQDLLKFVLMEKDIKKVKSESLSALGYSSEIRRCKTDCSSILLDFVGFFHGLISFKLGWSILWLTSDKHGSAGNLKSLECKTFEVSRI